MPRKFRRRTRKGRRKFSPRQTTFSQSKMRLSNKVEIIRPITMKPKSAMKKFIYYNTAEVRNGLIGGVQTCQFQTNYLNSLWFLREDTYADNGSNVWNWNKAMSTHVNGNSPQTGTSFPGSCESQTGFALGYQNHCVVGAKVTVTAAPIEIGNVNGGSPGALFAIVQTQASDLTDGTKIDDLYSKPFVQMKKIEGGAITGGQLTGNSKQAKITLHYSPKRFNNIKDIRDNDQFFGKINAARTEGTHPGELDRVSFGVVPMMSNQDTPNPVTPIMLQYKHEVTVLFTEPHNQSNEYPAMPIVDMVGGVVQQLAAL